MNEKIDFEKVQNDTFQGIKKNIDITLKGFDLSILDRCKELYDKGYSSGNELNSLDFGECMELGSYYSLIVKEIFRKGRFDELCQLLK